MLVAAMALNNLTLAPGFQITAQDEPPFNTMEVPWQMVKPLLFEFTARARQRIVQANRTVMNAVTEVDHFLLRKSLRRFAGEEEAILKSVVTLATVDDEKKFELGYSTTDHCTLCGGNEGGYDHIATCCPMTEHVRQSSPLKRILKSCLNVY